ncbi:hypothetical protein [Rhodopseudomonas palustris]|uniref:hypothetical protein n=1 Tax=Rhodopseudomonas palustris TaxID=1076 RepID=UPI001F31A7A7|nr:hypothetical protein [Rhodopseudomonas palustris]
MQMHQRKPAERLGDGLPDRHAVADLAERLRGGGIVARTSEADMPTNRICGVNIADAEVLSERGNSRA